MISDFRVSVDYFSHPKIIKLQRRLGYAGIIGHLALMAFSAKWKPSGDLDGMNNEDIEIAAGWQGDRGIFTMTLVDIGLLDLDGDLFSLHDWREHNPFAADHEARSKASKAAVRSRWNRKAGVDTQKYDVNTERNTNSNTERNTNSNTNSNTDRITDRNSLSSPFLSSPFLSFSNSNAHEKNETGLHPKTEELAKELAQSVTDAIGAIQPVTIRWLDDMHLLIEKDRRDPEEIRKVIKWVSDDDFWRSAITAPGSLRKNWAKIVAQMKARPKRKNIDDDAIAEFLRRTEEKTL